MRLLTIRAAIIVTIILVSVGVSLAQGSPQTPSDAPVVVQGRIHQGPEGAAAPGNTFVFIASEMGFGGKVVKGAPYSAEAITETIQTLADGNRIVNRISSVLYRDSEGRTRREQTLKGIGSFANSGDPMQTIFINDPVAGVSYTLDTGKKVAHRNGGLKLEQKLVPPGADPKTQRFEYRIETKVKQGATTRVVVPDGPMPTPGEFTLRTETGPIGYVLRTGDDNKRAVQESLGRQLVEGVEAEGTRTTLTIPAGEIGNDRDIQVVSERWYSPELQMVVMSKHSDPRSGETIYRLTNINRSEPVKTLFELPPGFTVSEGFPGVFKTTLPAKVKRQPE
jgi:hypothetical protein